MLVLICYNLSIIGVMFSGLKFMKYAGLHGLNVDLFRAPFMKIWRVPLKELARSYWTLLMNHKVLIISCNIILVCHMKSARGPTHRL